MAKTKTQIAEDITTAFGDLRDRRKTLEDTWLTYFEKLHAYQKLTALQQRNIKLGIKSNYQVNRVYSHNETKKPRIINTIFSHEPVIRARPYTPKSYTTFKLQERIVDKYVRPGLYLPFALGLHQALYAGTGFTLMDWEMEELDGEAIEGLTFHFLDLFDTYVPDALQFIKEAEEVYVGQFKRRDWLEKQQKKGNYKNIGRIEPLESTKLNSTYQRRCSILGITASEHNNRTGYNVSEADEIVWLIHEFTKDKVTTVANEGTIVREAEPLVEGIIPIYAIRDYPNDVMFYGQGEVELLKDIPDYQSKMKNMRIDYLNRIAYPAALVDINANIPEHELVSRPFQVVHTEDMQGYREIQHPTGSHRLFIEEEVIGKQDEQDVTAIYDWMKSGVAPRAETATMGLQMKEATMERINSMIFWTSIDYFGNLGRDASLILRKNMDLNLFLDNEEDIEKPEKVRVKQLVGTCNWLPSAFKIMSATDVALQQNALQIYASMSKSSVVEQREFTKRTLEALGFRNVEELLIDSTVSKIVDLLSENKPFAALVAKAAMDPNAVAVVQRIFQDIVEPTSSAKTGANQKSPAITSGAAAVTNINPGDVMSPERRNVS